jgi:hypothetical protein
MTANELTKHMTNDCVKIEVECSLCEVKFTKENLASHNCAGELRKKLDKAIEDLKEEEERVNDKIRNKKDQKEEQRYRADDIKEYLQ